MIDYNVKNDFYIVDDQDLKGIGSFKKELSLVLQGGGSKTITYLGPLQALFEQTTNNRFTISRILGTSAGGFIGFFIATGLTFSQIQAILYDYQNPFGNFKQTLDYIDPQERRKTFNTNLQTIVQAAKGSSHITNIFHTYLSSFISITKQLKILIGGASDALIQALINGEMCKGKGFDQLFSDILKYKGVDEDIEFHQFVQYFGCDLSMVTTDITSKMPRVLGVHTTPHLPVRMGLRMTGALPFMWPGVVWKKQWGLYLGREDISGHIMLDGGISQNFPLQFYVSEAEFIKELRGGVSVDKNSIIAMRLDQEYQPENMSQQQKYLVQHIPVAQFPSIDDPMQHEHQSFLDFSKDTMKQIWAIYEFIREIQGRCEKQNQHPKDENTYQDVIEKLKEIKGIKYMIGIFETMRQGYQNLVLNHYRFKQDQINIESLPTGMIHPLAYKFSEDSVRPYQEVSYEKTDKLIKNLFDDVDEEIN